MDRGLLNPSNVTFADWTGNRPVDTLGSNVGSSELPFQNWRRFKEAFAPELVERAIRETVGQVHHIVDPFGGSGTVALTAQFLGVRPTTIEVNPFLADLIKAKLAVYDVDEVAKAFGAVVDKVWRTRSRSQPIFRGAPPTFVEPGVKGRYIFSRRVAQQILSYRAAIAEVHAPEIRRLFSVLLGATLVPVSNVTISGKGRRYRGGWEGKEATSETLDSHFQTSVLSALHDIRRFGARQCCEYRVLRGDAREVTSLVEQCDLAVFSPPYPNSFDYTDVYNVELWGLGYLEAREQNTKLRNSTLRSHVQILRDMEGDERATPTLLTTAKRLRAVKDDLWNRHIPEMIIAYFADMRIVLSALRKRLREKGAVYMVVGDSRYAGIDVPVARILSELCPQIGYRIKETEPFRSMRASPQQGGRPELPETLVVLEKK